MLTINVSPITVIVPAAGIGSRMAAATAKQYLTLGQQTVIAHTLELLVSHPRIASVVVALHPQDQQFTQLSIAKHPKISRVNGGAERVDSVLNGLASLGENQWVMVHDAARPCLTHADIDKLLAIIDEPSVHDSTIAGAILAKPAIDTMKQTKLGTQIIDTTIDRETLWHALTPQLFNSQVLHNAIERAQQQNLTITDEASAMEHAGYRITLVQGHSSNIKITMPEDLALAEFYLTQQGRL